VNASLTLVLLATFAHADVDGGVTDGHDAGPAETVSEGDAGVLDDDTVPPDAASPDAASPDAASPDAASTDAASRDAVPTETTPSDDEAASDPIAHGDAPLAFAPPVDENDGHWGVGLVPRIVYNSDFGLGLGMRGSLFWYRWGQKPYKTSISFQLYATTRLVQEHYVRIDAIDAFNLPMRILAEVGYFQSITQNYCGIGNTVTCDTRDARREAERLSLGDVETERFVDRFYKLRYIAPYAKATTALRVVRLPDPLSVFIGHRATYYQPGDLVDENKDQRPDFFAYPGSLFDRTYSDGQVGLASVATVGVMLDGRDEEPAPRRGYLVEASVRGAHPLMLSRFTYFGGALIARSYVPLWGRDLVLASRYVLDVMVGDPPIPELFLVGGLQETVAFGGQDMGRGIRVQRYMGRVKTFMQQEVRWELPTISLLEQRIRPGLAAFLDVGRVGTDVFDPSPVLPMHMGFGVSVRIAWNDNFIMRLDLAISPDEGFSPTAYSGPNHPY
jgi:hypothetical protein